MARMPADSEAPSHDPVVMSALAGDTSAWAALYRKHNPRVLGALLARGVPGWLAQELAQEAWGRLLRQQRDGQLSFLKLPGLAVTTALHLYLDHVRAPHVRRRTDTEVFDRAAEGASAESVVSARETVARVVELLEQETPRDHRIFWSVAVEGRPTKAVAATHGLADITVRMLVARIRAALREIDRGNP